MVTIDATLLTSIYQAKLGLLGFGASTGTTGTTAPGTTPAVKLPTPPWDASSPNATTDAQNANVQRALLGSNFINLNNTQLDVPGASQDYQKLFALYQGLDTLSSLADRASQTGVSSGELTRIQAAFTRGMTEVGKFLIPGLGLQARPGPLASGAVSDSLTSTSGVSPVTTPATSPARS